MRRTRHAGVMMGLAAATAAPAPALAGVIGPFDFTLVPSASTVEANVSCSVSAPTGTAIGAYDPVSNPAGTRTRPGLDGPFGPTDNLPVPITLAGEIGDRLARPVAGGFRASLDPGGGATGQCRFSSLSIDLLGGGGGASFTMPASILFLTEDGFRTRNPDAAHPGGSPLQLRLTTGTLTALTVSQVGEAAGTLAPGPDPGQWLFSADLTVGLSATLVYLGATFTLPPAALQTLTITGVMSVSGEAATLVSLGAVGLSNSIDEHLVLGPLPFDLVTEEAPDQPAHLLLGLGITNRTVSLGGDLSIGADGVLVPSPGVGATMLAALGLAGAGRRRRRCAPS